MKRLLALILGGLGLRAWLRHRAHPVAAAPSADDLRAKLAETKTVDEPPASPQTVDDRRADVHARAREAMDELRQDGNK